METVAAPSAALVCRTLQLLLQTKPGCNPALKPVPINACVDTWVEGLDSRLAETALWATSTHAWHMIDGKVPVCIGLECCCTVWKALPPLPGCINMFIEVGGAGSTGAPPRPALSHRHWYQYTAGAFTTFFSMFRVYALNPKYVGCTSSGRLSICIASIILHSSLLVIHVCMADRMKMTHFTQLHISYMCCDQEMCGRTDKASMTDLQVL